MGILQWLFREPSTTERQAVIALADGSRHTPGDFGRVLMRLSHGPAAELFDSCFGEGSPGRGVQGGASDCGEAGRSSFVLDCALRRKLSGVHAGHSKCTGFCPGPDAQWAFAGTKRAGWA